MPKELHEIKNFMTGTVSTPTETDIPDDAASYSLNIDPVAEDGILKGIPDDTTLQSDGTFGSTSNAPVNATAMASVNDDGTYRAVYFDDFDDKIKKIDNLQGGAAFLVSDTISAITQANPAVVTTTAHPFATGQKVFIDGVVGMTQVNDIIFTITSVDANRFSLGVDSSAYGAWSSGGTVYGASPVSTAAESVTGIPTMQVNNKEVHIGMGKGATDKPLWCGIVPHSQFGTAVSGLQLEDAELKNPSPFPDIYKAVLGSGGLYLYGVEWQGTHVYKFDIAGSKLVKRSEKTFTQIQGLCLASDGNLWVVDNVSSTMHIIKVDTEDMLDTVDVVFTAAAAVTNVSDIIEIGTEIWFSKYGNTDSSTPHGLWNDNVADFVAGAGAQTLTQRTPWKGAASGEPDQGDWADGGDPDDELLVAFIVPKVALIDVGNANFCGWMVEPVIDATGDTGVYFMRSGDPGDTVEVGSVIQMIQKDSIYETKLITSGDAGKLLRLHAATDYSSGSNIVHGFTNGVTGLISYGVNDSTSSIVEFSDAGGSGKITYAETAQGGNTSGHGAVESATSIKNAFVLSVTDSGTQYHAFQGISVGRWAYGETGSLEVKLEAEVEITLGTQAGAWSAWTGSTDRHFYKVSYLYDGYQEGPLSDDFSTIYPADADHVVTATISLKSLSVLSKRISHINLYRATSETTTDARPTGFYRLIGSYKLNESWKEIVGSTSNPSWGNYRQKVIVDNGNVTASYEALNGISEVITDTLPNYGLSVQLNNQHFIADCSHPLLDNADLFLFKSRPYNFDQFDWSVDLLRLPTKPTALSSFNGRIYAFDENNTYRIEPNSLYIEDTFEGVGCIGSEAVVVTEYGMCFADKNNIYLHKGSQPTAIGTPILRGDDKSWQNRDTTWASKIVFDAERNSFVVMFKYDSNYYAWAFNIARTRWDLWELFATVAPLGTLTGKSGEIFISNGTNLIHYLGGSGNDDWTWHSKKLTMGQDTQTKIFKKTRVAGNTTDCIGTFVSSEGTPTDSSVADGVLDRVYTLSGAPSRAKWLQYKITAESNTVDAIGTIFRRRPVR